MIKQFFTLFHNIMSLVITPIEYTIAASINNTLADEYPDLDDNAIAELSKQVANNYDYSAIYDDILFLADEHIRYLTTDASLYTN
tara:strand:- start:4096 stop:4350 length:255 start_codon:yes stop_codon:yes gene_type:complete